ncbi:MAG: phospholipase [Bacteroidetes bacterium]|nr:MAG: phospholipase [Bacteroidota bacterium]
MDAYERHSLAYGAGKSLPYRVLYPENYDSTRQYPLVLFLHGRGECGTDNEKQLTHGAKLFLDPVNRRSYPAIVLFPQCPVESYWSSVKIDRSSSPATFVFDDSGAPSEPLAAVADLVQRFIQNGQADPSRVYITGLSMGGMGTFEMVDRHPELFAAAAPICGGGDTRHYSKAVRKIPFWVFHGGADPVVPVKHSREMVQKLESLRVSVKYSEYPGVGHNSWDNAFAEPDFLAWMFQQRRKK